jgi:hypothetical protein
MHGFLLLPVNDTCVDEAVATTETEIFNPFQLSPMLMLAVGNLLMHLPPLVVSKHAAELNSTNGMQEPLIFEERFS